MRNLLNIVSFGLLLAALNAMTVTVAAPAPPTLEELPPFRLEFDDFLKNPRIAKRSLLYKPDGFKVLSRRAFSGIREIFFSPDGKILYTPTAVPLSIWDVASRKRTDVIEFKGIVFGLYGTKTIFSPDGKKFAILDGKRIVLWDADSRKIHGILDEQNNVRSAVFGTDSQTLSAYVPNVDFLNCETLRIWDIDKKARVGKCKASGDLFYEVTADGGVKTPLLVETPRPAESGKTFGFTLVDAFTGRSVLSCEWLKEEAPFASRFAMNRSETIVASAGRESPVQLWDRNSGQRIARFKATPHFCAGLAFCPGGKILAAFYLNLERKPHDCGFVLYDVPTGKIRAQVKLPDGILNLALSTWAFSPDGRLLAVKTNEEIKVWRIPDSWRRDK